MRWVCPLIVCMAPAAAAPLAQAAAGPYIPDGGLRELYDTTVGYQLAAAAGCGKSRQPWPPH